MATGKTKRAVASKPEVSDKAVVSATGQSWEQWFAILDKARAKDWDHKTIVAYLRENYTISGWWQQTVTVGYERARGKRAVHQTRSGFVANKSKTISAPVETVFAFWTDGRKRKRWLAEPLTFSTKRLNKTLRFVWGENGERVSVGFLGKVNGKTTVTVQHERLKNQSAVAKQKAYWAERLEQLAQLVE